MAFMALLSSCSNRVDLYADYKDIPVIYGLLDCQQDTNFIRINRAFSSSNDNPINAYEVALIADSCNYPGKLDARIVELKQGFGGAYVATGTEFLLDTMTLHNKEEGIFYSPNQKVYFTTGRFKQNTGANKYKYRLVVNKDNDTVSGETGIVGGTDFRIVTQVLTFLPDDNSESRITFIPADNAVFYEMSIRFNYREARHGDIVQKSVSYNLGSGDLESLQEGNSYFFTYPKSLLFNMLGAAIGGDTIGVVRYPDKCIVSLAAGGEEMYNFIQVNNNGGGYSQTVPDYTNINGGYGVFSSRLTLKADNIKLSAPTLKKLYGRWGFVQE